ncbi:MAG: WbqC family protein [Prolixibacteraceae bacterium]|nr:WbqC family protein [Prolixibacteraceae bacterium]
MEQNQKILLSTAYFGPVQYYAWILMHPEVYIEQFEHFNKQTYRNRCVVLGGNGPIPLVVPVESGRSAKIVMKDLKISYAVNWQRNHWRTIFSAYNSSPFFEYYQDEIYPLFEKKWKFLLDLNQSINKIICKLLEIENNSFLTEYFEKVPENTLNFREIISPKNKMQPDENFKPFEYTQVFSERFEFVPNLSILDLLFNEGPDSSVILERSLFRG